MPKNVVAHFDLVEAAIESGNCTVTASTVDAALLANVAAAEVNRAPLPSCSQAAQKRPASEPRWTRARWPRRWLQDCQPS